jgi:hypothetical protein
MFNLDEVYGTPEEFLTYLEASECGCELCGKRIEWLRESIASGVEVKPPYFFEEV